MKIKLMVVAASLLAVLSGSLFAQEETKGTDVNLGSGFLKMTTPATWKKVTPRSRILTYEFSAPANAKEEEPQARITMMRAGGSIDANIERWYGQFTQPDGKDTADRAKVKKFEAAGQTVHWVDITGTFKESMGGGPFAPGKVVERKEYRMIGAIVATENAGQYFIKMTGPAKTCEELAEGFKEMLEKLQVK